MSTQPAATLTQEPDIMAKGAQAHQVLVQKLFQPTYFTKLAELLPPELRPQNEEDAQAALQMGYAVLEARERGLLQPPPTSSTIKRAAANLNKAIGVADPSLDPFVQSEEAWIKNATDHFHADQDIRQSLHDWSTALVASAPAA